MRRVKCAECTAEFAPCRQPCDRFNVRRRLHPDDAALGVQARNSQLFHVKHLDTRRAARASRPSGACPSSPARRRAAPAGCRDQSMKSGSEAKARELITSNGAVQASRPAHARRAGCGSSSSSRHLLDECGLLGHGVHAGARAARAADGDHHARQAGAGADVQQAAPAPPRQHAAAAARTDRQAVEQVMRQHLRRVAHRRQVVDPVPLQDQRAGRPAAASTAARRVSASAERAAPPASARDPAHSAASAAAVDGASRAKAR